MGWIAGYGNRIAALLMLACGGAGLGMAWSSVTESAVVWKRPALSIAHSPAVDMAVDQFAAGRSWAQAAFDGGLRRCPAMNADFLAGCEAEIKALAARPKPAPYPSDTEFALVDYEPAQPRMIEEAPVVVPTLASHDMAAEAYDEPEAEMAVIPATFEATPDNYPAAEPLPH